MPHEMPTFCAVSPLSPVSIHTFIFAALKSLMHYLQFSCSRSSSAVTPRSVRSHSRAFSSASFIDCSFHYYASSSFMANIQVRSPSHAKSSIYYIEFSSKSPSLFRIRGTMAMSAPFTKLMYLPSASRLTTTLIIFRSLVNSIFLMIWYSSWLPWISILIRSYSRRMKRATPESLHISKNVTSS